MEIIAYIVNGLKKLLLSVKHIQKVEGKTDLEKQKNKNTYVFHMFYVWKIEIEIEMEIEVEITITYKMSQIF